MASNVVRMSPAAMSLQPSQQDWVWNGANWCNPCDGSIPAPTPPPCPPPGWPTPCPPWFPPPAGQAPWYPGANGGVSFSATAPVNPIRGNLWWDGTSLHLFDGAAWVTIGPAVGGAAMGVTDGSVAAPGFIGEVIKLVANGTLSLLTPPGAAPTNFTALVVPPGDWDIQGQVYISNITGGVFWDTIQFTLTTGGTTVGFFNVFSQFLASAGGLTQGTFDGNMIPLSVSASTTISCALQVVVNSGGTTGTANYTFTTIGRRRR